MSVLLTKPGAGLATYRKSGGVIAPTEDRFTYYVSTSGSDAAAGTRAAPWQTLAKIVSHGLTPGQSVGLKRGDHWRESLLAQDTIGGTSAPAYVRFGAYGSGALPIIDGSDVHTSGWVSMSTAAGFGTPINPNPNFAAWTGAVPDSWTLDNYAGANCALTKVTNDSPTSTNSVQWVRTGTGLARVESILSSNPATDTAKTFALRVTAKRTSGTQNLTIGLAVYSGGVKWLQANGTWGTSVTLLPVTGVSGAWQTLTVKTGIVPLTGSWYQIEVRDDSNNGTTVIDSVEIVEEVPAVTSPLYTKDGLGTAVGVTMLDGVPLTWVEWTTAGGEAAAVAALKALPSGFAHNRAGKVYVHLPGDANPNGANVEVAVRRDCVVIHGVTHVGIRDIECRGAARNGLWIYDVGNFIFDVKASCLGGYWSALESFYCGNGVELSGDCSTVSGTVQAEDIFDVGFSMQEIDTDEDHTNGTDVRLTAHRCGFAGIELQIHPWANASSSLDATSFPSPVIVDTGRGWSGVRHNLANDFSFGHGIFISTPNAVGETRSISGVSITNPTITGSAGQGIWFGYNSGRLVVDGGRISDNALGGVYVQVIRATNTGALSMDGTVIVNNGGPGLSHNNWYGGAPTVDNCVIARNGSGTDSNVFLDGIVDPAQMHSNVFEGVGREAVKFVYNPSTAATSGNIYYRTDAGDVVSREGVGYTAQAAYRAVADGDALFTDPLFTDPDNGDYTR